MRASLAVALLVVPVTLAAQGATYSPDSAEYRLTMGMQPSGSPSFKVEQEMRALVVARPLERDSLIVQVTMLSIKFGQPLEGFTMELPSPLELRIPRSGYVVPAPVPGTIPPFGPSSFPRMFAQMIFPPLDARGRMIQDQALSRDSMLALGVEVSTSQSQLQDTTMHGQKVSRQRIQMSMHSDHDTVFPGAAAYPGGGRVPAMDMQLTTERWTDTAHRLVAATMENHVAPKEPPATMRDATMKMRMERVFPE